MLCATVMGGALVGCGDDTEPNTTSNNATGSSTGTGEMAGTGGMGGGTGGMGGMGGGTGGMGGMGGMGGGMMGSVINGCDPAMATDHTADAMTTVNIVGLAYDPPCIKVKVGSQVTFKGNFGNHPTVGGMVSGSMATPDPKSPILDTSAGMSATFAFDKAGGYPYYCTKHFGSGMMGAVFVVP
jgi:plastocyanin